MKRKRTPPDRLGRVARRLWAGFLIVAALLVPVGQPAVAGGAEAFIEDTADKVFTFYAGEVTDDQRAGAFREILTATFELRTIARFALGRYWRVASSDQREEYRRLFEDFLVLAYANRFRDLGGVKLRVTSVREINKRDQLVLSEVDPGGGRPPIRIGWRVRDTRHGLRIVDVIVDGISMGVTQRDQFAAAIRSAGGKVDGLLAMLRDKIAPRQ